MLLQDKVVIVSGVGPGLGQANARALAREGIRYDEVRLAQRRSRRPEVEALTGQRRVPVLVIDGEAICDSRRIVEHLELNAERRAQ